MKTAPTAAAAPPTVAGAPAGDRITSPAVRPACGAGRSADRLLLAALAVGALGDVYGARSARVTGAS